MLGLNRKIDKRKLLKLAAIAVTVAQTVDPSVQQAQEVTRQITPILMTLITVVFLITIPILVFKTLAKSVIDIIRG